MKTRIEAIRYNINWDKGPYTQHTVNEISEKYIYILQTTLAMKTA